MKVVPEKPDDENYRWSLLSKELFSNLLIQEYG